MSEPVVIPVAAFAVWLAQGERGTSSNAIVTALTGIQVGTRWEHADDYPYDPSDFRRCEILLRQVPLASLVFPSAMSNRSPVWKALVDAWDELVELAESEVPGCFSGPTSGSAPKTYARMRQLRDAALGVPA